MSMFGRALAGAGQAAAGIANKYIDEDLLTQRAQAIADIQRQSNLAQLQDTDAFNNDPTRVQRNRDAKVADITATGAAQNAVALAGKKAEMLDPELQAAETKRVGDIARAQAQAGKDAELQMISDPRYLKAKAALAQAEHFESAGSLATAALANFQLGQAKIVAGLQSDLARAQDSGDKDTSDKIQAKLDAITGKGGKVDKFYDIAGKIQSATTAANKTLNDPMATDEAKSEARTQIRQNSLLLTNAAKRAGVDLAPASFPPAPPGAIEMLKKDPKTADQFDQAFGPGAAAKALTSTGFVSPGGSAGGTPLSQRATYSDQTGKARLDAAAAAAGFKPTDNGNAYITVGPDGQGQIMQPADLAKKLGLTW